MQCSRKREQSLQAMICVFRAFSEVALLDIGKFYGALPPLVANLGAEEIPQ